MTAYLFTMFTETFKPAVETWWLRKDSFQNSIVNWQCFPGGASGKESTCHCSRSLIPGLGRSPEGGRGNRLQYSCLENYIRQRSLVVYRVTKSQDNMKRFSTIAELTTQLRALRGRWTMKFNVFMPANSIHFAAHVSRSNFNLILFII